MFSEEVKRGRGVSVSQTARRYGIAARVLFRWKEALRPKLAE
jgi:transposase-like protein